MKKYLFSAAMATVLAASAGACAEEKKPEFPKLDVSLGGIKDGGSIPVKYAYCRPDGRGFTRDGDNISPAISWRGAPEGTKSFAIVMVDKDVPADFSKANKQGMEIPADAPRQNFYHWSVVSIPPALLSIPEGKASHGIIKGGKPAGQVEFGVTGQNDFKKMADGPNGGYDGPCPPWNDKRLHHYYFDVYALNVPALPIYDTLTGKVAEEAMRGHILAKGEVMGTYTNNLDVLDGQ